LNPKKKKSTQPEIKKILIWGGRGVPLCQITKTKKRGKNWGGGFFPPPPPPLGVFFFFCFRGGLRFFPAFFSCPFLQNGFEEKQILKLGIGGGCVGWIPEGGKGQIVSGGFKKPWGGGGPLGGPQPPFRVLYPDKKTEKNHFVRGTRPGHWFRGFGVFFAIVKNGEP